MNIGYARVLSPTEDLSMQVKQLRGVGCEIVFAERISASRSDRPELTELISQLEDGDEVVVLRLDRFTASVIQTHDLLSQIRSKGATFFAVAEGLRYDFSREGNLMFDQLTALAQFERENIANSVKDGINYSREKGTTMGRPPLEESRREAIRALVREGRSHRSVAKEMGCSRTTIRRIIAERTG